MLKKLCWIWLIPVILIVIILLILFVVFLLGRYSVAYGADDDKSSVNAYDDLEHFEVTDTYQLLVSDESLLPIAAKFNVYLEKIYGQPFTIVNEPTSAPFIALTVDEGVAYDYAFVGDNRNITVCADNKDHLLRGAYAFLEEFGGVKCYTYDLTEYTAEKITFPQQENGYTQVYHDYFEMRDTDWLSPQNDEYSWFRGFNADTYRYRPADVITDETGEEAEALIAEQTAYYNSLGGSVQYLTSFAHTFTKDFLDSEKYYDKGENLACYALDAKGNRRRDELCLSNPKTLEIVLDEVFAILENRRESGSKTKYHSDAPLQIISLTQADDLTACKCEECVSNAKAHGGYGYTNLAFVNKVAKAVKAAGYDNVAIDTFAYRYTRGCPTDIVPEDNVIIRLCSIECCSSHYIDDENCLANKAFMKDLEDWSKICDRIYIWDYCSDFSHFATLFPDINVVAHNIRVFYEHNVKGIYEEGNYTLAKDGSDPEFAELRAYVISKVMQNPYCDYEAVMKDFCNAYYGEAGEDMYTFITKADTYAGRRHLNIYKSPKLVLKCSKAELTELNDLFEHAKSVATGDDLKRVKNSEICWRYHKMYNRLFEFSKISDYRALSEHVIYDFAATKAKRVHEVDAMYALSGLAQNAIVDLRPLFDFVVGNFVYGP